MAEIEVVSEGGRRDGGEGEERRRQQQGAAGEPPADPVVDVYSAAAYGDLERLRGFVEQGGAGAAALREPDGNGYHALQWAALNNYPHVALYIIEVGLGFLAGFDSALIHSSDSCSPYSFADDGDCSVSAARGRRECDGPRTADGAALGGRAWVHFRGRRC
jgi:hypothetical protein